MKPSDPSGYAHSSYALSHRFTGEPYDLPRCGGSLILRTIPGAGYRDAIGCYPLFACADWSGLEEDVAGLPDDVIAVSLVADPLGDFDPVRLRSALDFARPYKQHYVCDLQVSFASYMHRHHRRYAKKALSAVSVGRASDPQQHAVEWINLYGGFCQDRGIRGLAAFTATSLASQLAVPGCDYFRAFYEGNVVGALLCFTDRGNAYAHLVATSPKGRELNAQYALYWEAIECLRGRARWMSIGAVPDTASAGSGLAFFKAGWANTTRTAYFCGKVLRRQPYDAICSASLVTRHDFFPAYRTGFQNEGGTPE